MKKIILITEEDFKTKLGVAKKIKGQANAFMEHGFETYMFYVNGDRIIAKSLYEKNKETVWKKRKSIIGLMQFYKTAMNFVKELKPDVVYIRSPFHEPNYIRFLRKLKKNGIRIFVEVPTYPYDNEYKNKSFLKRNMLWIDKIYRRKVKKYVEHCITYTQYSEIFGIKATKIENGIVASSIPLANKREGEKDNTLNLIGVANVSNWHGYDRVIKGLSDYKSKHEELPVSLSIIGEGNAYNELEVLAKKFDLTEKVKLYGSLNGKSLDAKFTDVDIGVDVLGMHRRGYNECASLKARDYCARGIPFITSANDKDFPEQLDFVLKIPSNEEPVDIQSVIDFYEKVSKIEDLQQKMRQYAEKHLTWKVKLKPVIDKMLTLAND